MDDFPAGHYRCIVIDPPWQQEMLGGFQRHQSADTLPYGTMDTAAIAALPIERLALPGTHLWLWTTNRYLHAAFHCLEAWNFTYLTTITWVKPSGLGAWFVSTTQHCLFAYYRRCEWPAARYLPTHFFATPRAHSRKPDEFYTLVRRVSPAPRIDLFNRRSIDEFEGWGDEAPATQAKQLRLL